jgi:hypothetical protein
LSKNDWRIVNSSSFNFRFETKFIFSFSGVSSRMLLMHYEVSYLLFKYQYPIFIENNKLNIIGRQHNQPQQHQPFPFINSYSKLDCFPSCLLCCKKRGEKTFMLFYKRLMHSFMQVICTVIWQPPYLPGKSSNSLMYVFIRFYLCGTVHLTVGSGLNVPINVILATK